MNTTTAQKAFSLFCCLLLVGMEGCATIMTGMSAPVNIATNPPGAKFKLYRNNVLIHNGVSPQVVQLKKRGKYAIEIEMEGMEPVRAPIRKGVSGWYIFGNLVFGGLLGYLIVDPISGAIFTFPKKHTQFELVKKKAELKGLKEGLVIASLDEIPKPDRARLVPLLVH